MTDGTNSHIKHYSADDVVRLKQVVKEGVEVEREINTLKEGIRDTVKAVAEEMGIKPSDLNRVIKTAYKGNFNDHKESFEVLEDLLDTLNLK